MESIKGPSHNSVSDAAAAKRTLKSLATDRHVFADRIKTPSWYYPLLGVATALIIGSPGGGIGALSQSMMVVYGWVGLISLEIVRKKVTGVSISRLPGPKSVGAAIALCLFMMLLLGVSFALAATGNSPWIILSAVAAFLGIWLGGYFYDRIFARELRDGR